jgi:hypothetical protein
LFEKQVNNKIQEATFFIKVQFLTSVNKMSYHVMAGAFREKRMLIKYSNASLSWIQAKRIEANKYGLYGFMAVTPPMRKQIKRKKEIQKTDNPEAWL